MNVLPVCMYICTYVYMHANYEPVFVPVSAVRVNWRLPQAKGLFTTYQWKNKQDDNRIIFFKNVKTRRNVYSNN